MNIFDVSEWTEVAPQLQSLLTSDSVKIVLQDESEEEVFEEIEISDPEEVEYIDETDVEDLTLQQRIDSHVVENKDSQFPRYVITLSAVKGSCYIPKGVRLRLLDCTGKITIRYTEGNNELYIDKCPEVSIVLAKDCDITILRTPIFNLTTSEDCKLFINDCPTVRRIRGTRLEGNFQKLIVIEECMWNNCVLNLEKCKFKENVIVKGKKSRTTFYDCMLEKDLMLAQGECRFTKGTVEQIGVFASDLTLLSPASIGNRVFGANSTILVHKADKIIERIETFGCSLTAVDSLIRDINGNQSTLIINKVDCSTITDSGKARLTNSSIGTEFKFMGDSVIDESKINHFKLLNGRHRWSNVEVSEASMIQAEVIHFTKCIFNDLIEIMGGMIHLDRGSEYNGGINATGLIGINKIEHVILKQFSFYKGSAEAFITLTGVTAEQGVSVESFDTIDMEKSSAKGGVASISNFSVANLSGTEKKSEVSKGGQLFYSGMGDGELVLNDVSEVSVAKAKKVTASGVKHLIVADVENVNSSGGTITAVNCKSIQANGLVHAKDCDKVAGSGLGIGSGSDLEGMQASISQIGDEITIKAGTIKIKGNFESSGGSFTHEDTNVGHDHRHIGVKSGPTYTGPPN